MLPLFLQICIPMARLAAICCVLASCRSKEIMSPLPSSTVERRDGEGTVILSPAAPVQVRTPGTWTLEYTAGPSGIRQGGGIVFQAPPFWGWSAPQSSNPDAPGYTTIHCSRKEAEFEIQESDLHWIQFQLAGADLVAGDIVRIVYGDTVNGSHPGGSAITDRYADGEQEFVIKTDADGDSNYAEIARQPALRITAAPAVQLFVSASPHTTLGGRLWIRVAALDQMENRAEDFIGDVVVSCSGLPEQEYRYTFNSTDKGAHEFRLTAPMIAGFYRFAAKTDSGMSASSPPVWVTARPLEFQLCWSDLHGHSGISDGTGAPEDYFAYARDVSGLTACALTDHDAFGVRALDEQPETWSRIQRECEAAYEPGRFVTFPAYEWTSWTYGHKHVLFPVAGDWPICSARSAADPSALWRCLPPGAITISHHTGGGPIGADWSFTDAQREMLAEISSIHGSSESYGALRMIYRPKPGGFVFDALNAGIRLGMIGGGDTHNGHPGLGDPRAFTNGLGGIWTREFSREDVWEALTARRTYATSGARILLWTTLGGIPMGNTIALPTARTELKITAYGERDIVKAELLRNGEPIHTARDLGEFIDITQHVSGLAPGDWLMVRLTQDDEELAWSSPWWVEENGSPASD